MRFLTTTVFFFIAGLLFGQSSVEFKAALSSEVQRLKDDEKIVVEFKKSGCWGDYEGGNMTFHVDQRMIHIKLISTTTAGDDTVEMTRKVKKNDYLAELNAPTLTEKDPENVAIGNFIYYNIKKNSVSVYEGNSTLEPQEVTTRVALKNNFQKFFKSNDKKAGILINN